MPAARSKTAQTFVIRSWVEPATAVSDLGDEDSESMAASSAPSMPDFDSPPPPKLPPPASRPQSVRTKMLRDVGRGATAETLTVQEQEEVYGSLEDPFPMTRADSHPEINIEAPNGEMRRLSTKDSMLVKIGHKAKCCKMAAAAVCLVFLLVIIAVGFAFGLQLFDRKERRHYNNNGSLWANESMVDEEGNQTLLEALGDETTTAATTLVHFVDVFSTASPAETPTATPSLPTDAMSTPGNGTSNTMSPNSPSIINSGTSNTPSASANGTSGTASISPSTVGGGG